MRHIIPIFILSLLQSCSDFTTHHGPHYESDGLVLESLVTKSTNPKENFISLDISNHTGKVIEHLIVLGDLQDCLGNPVYSTDLNSNILIIHIEGPIARGELKSVYAPETFKNPIAHIYCINTVQIIYQRTY